jgi:hypothetical protein
MGDYLGYLGIILFLVVAIWQLSIRVRLAKLVVKLLAQPFRRKKE